MLKMLIYIYRITFNQFILIQDIIVCIAIIVIVEFMLKMLIYIYRITFNQFILIQDIIVCIAIIVIVEFMF